MHSRTCIGPWKSVWLLRELWHFHFYGGVPLALVKGRERPTWSNSGPTSPPTENTTYRREATGIFRRCRFYAGVIHGSAASHAKALDAYAYTSVTGP